MKLNWDGPHMPLLAPMLVVPAGGDGADAVAAGAAAANEVPPPPPAPVTPPPNVPPTHTSSSTPGPSTTAQDTHVRDPTPMREPTPVREPTPSPVREPTTFPEPTPEPPRPSLPPCPTKQTSFIEDISEDGDGCVSSPKSNKAPPTTAAGGAEDSVALTDLSLKLDRYINRVTTLENEFGVTKKVFGGVVLNLVSRVKRLEGILKHRKRRMVLSDSESEEAATKEPEINLDALHELASMSLGGDTTIEATYTIFKAFHDAHASSDDSPDEDETIPAGSTPIPTTGGVSAGSSIDPVGQAAAAPSSSAIPATDKGKALMRNLEQSNLLNFKRSTFRPKPTLEAPTAKRARQGVPQVSAASSQVHASVLAAPSIAADVSFSAVSTTTADVSPAPTLLAESVTEVHANESGPDENQSASEQISAEHTSTTVAFTSGVSHATPSSLCKRRNASESDGDPSPYEHTKHFTSLRKLLHMVEKNDLKRLLGDVDKFYQRQEPETFGLILWGDLRVFFSRLLMRMHTLSAVIRKADVFAAGFISSPSCLCAGDCGWTSHEHEHVDDSSIHILQHMNMRARI
nr:hypothetical protein [Tanacetum cinerariifolium]